MSEVSKAVFLSYPSQDAEAARRLCDALRAAGVEVWFDQSELRGGDAWTGDMAITELAEILRKPIYLDVQTLRHAPRLLHVARRTALRGAAQKPEEQGAAF